MSYSGLDSLQPKTFSSQWMSNARKGWQATHPDTAQLSDLSSVFFIRYSKINFRSPFIQGENPILKIPQLLLHKLLRLMGVPKNVIFVVNNRLRLRSEITEDIFCSETTKRLPNTGQSYCTHNHRKIFGLLAQIICKRPQLMEHRI